MNSKPDRLKFNKDSISLILSNGGFVKNSVRREYRIIGDKNSITLTLPLEEEQKIIYTIYGRFEHPCNLSSLSGKYNFHSEVPDPKYYIKSILEEL